MGFSIGHLFGAVGHGIKEVGHGIATVGKDAQKAVEAVGNVVEKGADLVKKGVDKAANAYENSSFGKSGFGKFVGIASGLETLHYGVDAADHAVHFGVGLGEGVAGMATGLVTLTGGLTECVGDPKMALQIASNPGAIISGIGTSIKEGFKKDPAQALGNLSSMLIPIPGGAIAGAVGKGAEAAGDVGRFAGAASKVSSAAGKVAKVPGKIAERAKGGASAISDAAKTAKGSVASAKNAVSEQGFVGASKAAAGKVRTSASDKASSVLNRLPTPKNLAADAELAKEFGVSPGTVGFARTTGRSLDDASDVMKATHDAPGTTEAVAPAFSPSAAEAEHMKILDQPFNAKAAESMDNLRAAIGDGSLVGTDVEKMLEHSTPENIALLTSEEAASRANLLEIVAGEGDPTMLAKFKSEDFAALPGDQLASLSKQNLDAGTLGRVAEGQAAKASATTTRFEALSDHELNELALGGKLTPKDAEILDGVQAARGQARFEAASAKAQEDATTITQDAEVLERQTPNASPEVKGIINRIKNRAAEIGGGIRHPIDQTREFTGRVREIKGGMGTAFATNKVSSDAGLASRGINLAARTSRAAFVGMTEAPKTAMLAGAATMNAKGQELLNGQGELSDEAVDPSAVDASSLDATGVSDAATTEGTLDPVAAQQELAALQDQLNQVMAQLDAQSGSQPA